MKKIISVLTIIGILSVSYAQPDVQFPLHGRNDELVLGLGSLDSFNFSPDGKFIATAGDSGAFLWDANTGKMLRLFHYGSSNFNTIAFTPDSSRLLTLNWDKTVLWDVQTGAEILSFDSHLNAAGGLTFSPDGRYVFIGSYDGNFIVEIWDLTDGSFQGNIALHTGTLGALAVSSDGKILATGSGDGYARLWNIETGDMVNEFQHSMNVDYVLLSPDGRYLLSQVGDNRWFLWDTSSNDTARRLFDSTNRLLQFTPDSRQILGWKENTLFYYDIAAGTSTPMGNAPTIQENLDGRLSPDGKSLGVWDWYSNQINIWDMETGNYRCTIQGHMDGVLECRFSPDETKVYAVGANAGTFYEFDVASGTMDRSCNFRRDYFVGGAVGISQDGRYAVMADHFEKWIKVWDTATGNEIQSISDTESIGSISFSSDNQRILTGGGQSETWAALWSLTAGTKITAFSTPRTPRTRPLVTPQCYSWDQFGPCAVFSPDESKLATISGSFLGYSMDQRIGNSTQSSVRIWDADTGTLIRSFPAHEDIISTVTFSRDGQWIVTGSNDKTAKLWNAETGEEQMVFSGQNDSIIAVALSPDNRYLLTSSPENSGVGIASDAIQRVVLWDTRTGEKLGSLQGHSSLVLCVNFSSDGKRILTGSTDGSIRIWNMDDVIQASGVDDFCLYE